MNISGSFIELNSHQFKYEGGATVHGACSVTYKVYNCRSVLYKSELKGHHYVFGGYQNGNLPTTQVSRIEACNLRRKEFELPFNFTEGACNTFDKGYDAIYSRFSMIRVDQIAKIEK